MSIKRRTEIAMVSTPNGVEGTTKKSRATRMLPRVRVVKEKSKKPEPLECIFGGETKIETRSNTHHRKVMPRKSTSNHLSARTDHKLKSR